MARSPLGFDLAALAAEGARIQQQLIDGLQLLPQLEEVVVGASARQLVWQDADRRIQPIVRRLPVMLLQQHKLKWHNPIRIMAI